MDFADVDYSLLSADELAKAAEYVRKEQTRRACEAPDPEIKELLRKRNENLYGSPVDAERAKRLWG